MQQPNFFETEKQIVDAEKLVLYALGEFQARKKELADRELPLDRLRGAFRRASEVYQTDELSDENLINELEKLNARIKRVPAFVAKHPFRVTVGEELAVRAADFYRQTMAENAETKL